MARLLIVDDEADACAPLAKHRRSQGHEVECLPNGKDARDAPMQACLADHVWELEELLALLS